MAFTLFREGIKFSVVGLITAHTSYVIGPVRRLEGSLDNQGRVQLAKQKCARIASGVLATAIPSVCLSVCHTPVLCQNDGT